MDSFPASTLHIVPGSWAFIDFRQCNKHGDTLEWILRTLTRQVWSLEALFFHPASQLFSPPSFSPWLIFPSVLFSVVFSGYESQTINRQLSCTGILLSYFTCDLQSPEADFVPRSNPCLLFWGFLHRKQISMQMGVFQLLLWSLGSYAVLCAHCHCWEPGSVWQESALTVTVKCSDDGHSHFLISCYHKYFNE